MNKIINGDCILSMQGITDKSIDMVFCDLPYGTTKNKWDCIIDLPSMWNQLERICKDNAALVFTAQVPFNIILGYSKIEWLRYEWIWEKTLATGHLNAKKMPMKSHENIMVFYKNPPIYTPQKTKGHQRKVSLAEHNKRGKQSENYGQYKNTSYDSTERYPRSVQVFKSDRQKSAIHPTQKPVEMIKYFIKTYTDNEAVILDMCAGSGSTSIAAIESGRKCTLIEKELPLCKKIVERVNEYGALWSFKKNNNKLTDIYIH